MMSRKGNREDNSKWYNSGAPTTGEDHRPIPACAVLSCRCGCVRPVAAAGRAGEQAPLRGVMSGHRAPGQRGVLEAREDDRAEISRAGEKKFPSGIVLVQWPARPDGVLPGSRRP